MYMCKASGNEIKKEKKYNERNITIEYTTEKILSKSQQKQHHWIKVESINVLPWIIMLCGYYPGDIILLP